MKTLSPISLAFAFTGLVLAGCQQQGREVAAAQAQPSPDPLADGRERAAGRLQRPAGTDRAGDHDQV